MRAAGAEHRRTRRSLHVRLVAALFGDLREEGASHDLWRQFVYPGELFAADALNAKRLYEILEVGFVLFDDVERLHGGCEFGDLLRRQRPGEAQLEIGSFVAEDFFRVVVRDAARDDADLAGAALNAVERRRLAEFLHGGDALFHNVLAFLGGGRGHHELGRILDVGLDRDFRALAGLDEPLAVADARRDPEEQRRVELFGNFEGLFDEIVALLAVGRLQHRELGVHGVVAVVLLVLRAEQPRIVCRYDHKTAVDAGVGVGKHRVGGHVEAHVLHCRESSGPSHRRTSGHLDGDLLIGRPLGIDLFVSRQVFQYLRGRSARIGGRHVQSGFPGAARDRFVSCHDLFHLRNPLLQKKPAPVLSRPKPVY